MPLSISTVMGCSGQVLRHRVGAEHPKTGQVSRQKQVGPPALMEPRNIYLYQVEQLHQEKHQFRPGWGVFGSTEPVGRGGGSSDTLGGPVTMWEPCAPALLCMGVFG